MRVKISWNEGTTFSDECDLSDAFHDCDEYATAWNELHKRGRYWAGGGAAPLALLVIIRD